MAQYSYSSCSLSLYDQWIARCVSRLETLKDPEQEVEVEIVLKKSRKRLSLTDLFFEVYWDNKRIGTGRCKKGFSLKTRTAAGAHRLTIERQYIRYQPLPVVVENQPRQIVRLDYKIVFLKGEYRFFISKEEETRA